MQAEVTKVQVELGRVTVLLESCERERARMEHAAQQRAAQLDERGAVLERVERSLQEKDEALRARSITDTNVRHEIELSELRLKELASQLAQARRTVEEQREQVRRAEEERRLLAQKAEVLGRAEEKLVGAESALAARDEELAAANRHVGQLKGKVKELQTEMTALRQADQRVSELKALLERQGLHLEQAEKEEASKSAKIIEKERETGRVREKLAAVQGELDAERMRRSQAEATARELEAASSRAVQLEGQLAGVSQVLSQRTRDLEESRALVAELRDRVSRGGGGAGGGNNATARSIGANMSAAELDAKLRAKDETIARLQQEEQRRHSLVDSLRRDLANAENDKATLERQLQDLQTRLDRADVSWRARCTRLEQELSDGKRVAIDGRTRRLEEELLDLKCKNSTLTSEVDRLRRELSVAQQEHETSAREFGTAASSRLQQEMRRSRASLEGIYGGGGGGGRADSPYTSPEPKKRTVRSVLGSSASAAAGSEIPRSFLNGNAAAASSSGAAAAAGPSSPLNL
jgi:chromosome segregation ATPase